jgi:hypothetical protein
VHGKAVVGLNPKAVWVLGVGGGDAMKALGVDVLFKTLEVFGIDAKGEPQEAFFVALDDPGIALRVVEGVNGQTVTVVFDFQAKVGVKRPGVFQVGHTQDVLVE